MATAALAQEKVWFDKPSYDKAERLYFERRAKVVPRKIVESCVTNSDNSLSNNLRDTTITNTVMKSKCEKHKESKSQAFCNSNEVIRQTNYQIKNVKAAKKENDNNVQRSDNTEEKKKCENTEAKEKNIVTNCNVNEKCNLKEIKEKKNKADTRHRNRGKGKNDMKEQKEQLPEQTRTEPEQGNQQSTCPILPAGGSLASEVAKARQHIKQSLQCMDDIAAMAGVSNQDLASRVAALGKENQELKNVVQELQRTIQKLGERVEAVEKKTVNWPYVQICPPCPPSECPRIEAQSAKDKNDDNDEDVDLFGSDSEGEDAEAARIREERLAAYAAKKSKKPAVIAKSNIILDVKPWDDETDMKLMETEVRKIETDGLLWGAAKLVPLAFGIHKLQISCVVEDDKVSVDWLTEKIQDIEDYVQSVDIAAFNKV